MVTIIRFETGSPCLQTNNPFLLSHHILHCLMTTETSYRDSRSSYTMSEQLLLYILKNDRKDDASYNNDCFRRERGKITVSFQ